MSSIKLKIIKQKNFEYEGTKHTFYTCAYKGRVFGVSTMLWSEDLDSLKAKDNVLTITTDVEVKKTPGTVDQLTGEVSPSFFNIVPQLGLVIADI